jgi:hypothetical protein
MKTTAKGPHRGKVKQALPQGKGGASPGDRSQQRRKVKARPSFWRRWRWGIVGLVAVVVILGIVWLTRSSSGDINSIVTYNNLSRNHVTGSVTYAQIPPVGGKHNAVWQNCGIYSQSVANENAVHSLEHGAVWITYQPSLDPSSIAQLQGLVRGHDHALLSPYPGLPSPVVISAWGVQLRVNSASDPRLAQFVSKYEQGTQTPEPGAPCSGGTGTPDGQ